MNEIKIGEGFDNVQFGMFKYDIEGLFGKADEVESFTDHDSEEDKTEAWHYDDKELSASFDENEDYKLTLLSVSSPDFKLAGKQLIGLNEEDFLNETKSLDLGESEIEDWSTKEDPGNKVISYADSSINFWFDEGELKEISWAPLYDEDNEIIWPE